MKTMLDKYVLGQAIQVKPCGTNWIIKSEGASCFMAAFPNKELALKKAEKIADKFNAIVKLFDEDGKVYL